MEGKGRNGRTGRNGRLPNYITEWKQKAMGWGKHRLLVQLSRVFWSVHQSWCANAHQQVQQGGESVWKNAILTFARHNRWEKNFMSYFYKKNLTSQSHTPYYLRCGRRASLSPAQEVWALLCRHVRFTFGRQVQEASSDESRWTHGLATCGQSSSIAK